MKEWFNKIITTKFHIGWVFLFLLSSIFVLSYTLATLIS